MESRLSPELKNALAGASAGLITAVITCPLDMIKIRLQNKSGNSSRATIKDIWVNEGVKGMYRGVRPTVSSYLPTWSIYFFVYGSTKRFYRANLTGYPDTFYNIMAALHAGLTSTITTNPLWVIRTRMMIQPAAKVEGAPYYYRSTIDAFRTIIRMEGWKALYKGLVPSIFGVSHVVIQFPIYEHLKSLSKDDPIKNSHILMSSAISKMIASSITYPHEVIRTRMHTQTVTLETLTNNRYLGGTSVKPKNPKYLGIFQSAKVIFREETWRGFYKGFTINLFRTVPASAMTIMSYEFISRKLELI